MSILTANIFVDHPSSPWVDDWQSK